MRLVLTEEDILLESVAPPPLDDIEVGVGLELVGSDGDPWCPLGVEAPEPGPRTGFNPLPVVMAAISSWVSLPECVGGMLI